MRICFSVGTSLAAGLFVIAFAAVAPADPIVQTLYDRVEMVTFDSSVLGTSKNFCAVLPDDYDPNVGDWPVLFLLHGRGRHERTLVDDSGARASLLAGNFITILPDGDDSWWIDSKYGNYGTYLEEVVALAETQYGLSTDASNRALTGWSMGGYGSMRFAQTHADNFSSISPIIGLLDYPTPASDFPAGQSYPVRTEVFPTDPAEWPAYNPINYAENIADMAVQIITGTTAFDRTMNENFSARLSELNIDHEYTVLNGSHSLDVVHASLPLVVSHVGEVFGNAQPPVPKITFQEDVSPHGTYQAGVVHIRNDSGNTENSTYFIIGDKGDSADSTLRGLLSFDLSAVPEGANIDSVSLTLTAQRDENFLSADITHSMELYRLTRPFVEGETDWSNAASGQAWTTPGGDFDPTPLATLDTNPYRLLSEGPEHTWETDALGSNAAFLQAVNDALQAGEQTLSLMLFAPDAETAAEITLYFWHSDDGTGTPLGPRLEITYRTPQLPGDANLDGVVNGEDAAALAANWQTPTGATWADGDFNDDGRVDDADAALLAANWQTSTPGAQSIPEPGAAMLLLAGAIAASCFLRRRR